VLPYSFPSSFRAEVYTEKEIISTPTFEHVSAQKPAGENLSGKSSRGRQIKFTGAGYKPKTNVVDDEVMTNDYFYQIHEKSLYEQRVRESLLWRQLKRKKTERKTSRSEEDLSSELPRLYPDFDPSAPFKPTPTPEEHLFKPVFNYEWSPGKPWKRPKKYIRLRGTESEEDDEDIASAESQSNVEISSAAADANPDASAFTSSRKKRPPPLQPNGVHKRIQPAEPQDSEELLAQLKLKYLELQRQLKVIETENEHVNGENKTADAAELQSESNSWEAVSNSVPGKTVLRIRKKKNS